MAAGVLSASVMIMYRAALLVAAALSGAALASGCSAPAGRATKPAVRVGCEDAVAQATASGRADASLYAKTSLKYQIQELKGYMLKDGYRAVALKSQRVDCRPYPLTLGLTRCVATATLCSR